MSEVNNALGIAPASLPETTDVLIVGGGPVDSALAAELRLRGVHCLIVEKETEIPDTPVRAMYLNMRTSALVDILRGAGDATQEKSGEIALNR